MNSCLAKLNTINLLLIVFFFKINSGDGSFAQEDEFFGLEQPHFQPKIKEEPKAGNVPLDKAANQVAQESTDWTDSFDDPATIAAVSVGAAVGGIGIAALIALIYKGYMAYKDINKPKTINRYLSEMLDYCLESDRRSGFRETYIELSPIQKYIQEKGVSLSGEEVLVLSRLIGETISFGINDVSGRSTRGLNIRPNTRLLSKLEEMQNKIYKTLSEFDEYNSELEKQIRSEVDENKKTLINEMSKYQEQKKEELINLKIMKNDTKKKFKNINLLEQNNKDPENFGLRDIAGRPNPVVEKSRVVLGLDTYKKLRTKN
jgi:hypothetical protein